MGQPWQNHSAIDLRQNIFYFSLGVIRKLKDLNNQYLNSHATVVHLYLHFTSDL